MVTLIPYLLLMPALFVMHLTVHSEIYNSLLSIRWHHRLALLLLPMFLPQPSSPPVETTTASTTPPVTLTREAVSAHPV